MTPLAVDPGGGSVVSRSAGPDMIPAVPVKVWTVAFREPHDGFDVVRWERRT